MHVKRLRLLFLFLFMSYPVLAQKPVTTPGIDSTFTRDPGSNPTGAVLNMAALFTASQWNVTSLVVGAVYQRGTDNRASINVRDSFLPNQGYSLTEIRD